MREHEQVTKPQGALMCDFSQYPRNGQLAKRQNKPYSKPIVFGYDNDSLNLTNKN